MTADHPAGPEGTPPAPPEGAHQEAALAFARTRVARIEGRLGEAVTFLRYLEVVDVAAEDESFGWDVAVLLGAAGVFALMGWVVLGPTLLERAGMAGSPHQAWAMASTTTRWLVPALVVVYGLVVLAMHRAAAARRQDLPDGLRLCLLPVLEDLAAGRAPGARTTLNLALDRQGPWGRVEVALPDDERLVVALTDKVVPRPEQGADLVQRKVRLERLVAPGKDPPPAPPEPSAKARGSLDEVSWQPVHHGQHRGLAVEAWRTSYDREPLAAADVLGLIRELLDAA